MLAQFKVKLRLRHAAGGADAADPLAALDLVATLDADAVSMGVGAGPTARVPDQDQIAEARQAIASIGDIAVGGSHNRRATRGGNVDAVIVQSSGFRTVVGNDSALYGD